MKMTKLMAVAVILTLVGCASTGDVEGIQSQVDTLKVSVAQVSTDALAAQATASDAASKATAAQIAADKAAQLCLEAGSKLDRMFKKAMLK